jgi:hypothetical protein
VVTDAIRNYFISSGQSTAQQPVPPTQHARTANVSTSQIISMIRELMRSNTTVIDRYNTAMQEHIQNTRALIDIIRILTTLPSQPIHRSGIRTPSASAYDYFPQESRRPTHIRQPSANNLFSYLLYPSTIGPTPTSLFENVIIRPTREQIENASESFVYDGRVELLNTQCPITMDVFQPGDRIRRIHYCRHSFLEDSFMSWFQNHVRCPICRHDIREHIANNTTNPSNNNDNGDGDNDGDSDEDSNNGITGSYTVHEPATVVNQLPSTTIPTISHSNLGNSLEQLLRAALAIDPSNNNTTELQQYLRTTIDISNTPFLSFEIPIEYEEYYDSSNNILGRGFLGRR